MTAYINKLTENGTKSLQCSHPKCKRVANIAHHIIRRCNGGSDDVENLMPLCFYHHHKIHAAAGDWARWGRRGGIETASNSENWLRNLSWAKIMNNEAPALFQCHVRFYDGVHAANIKPPTLKEWRKMTDDAKLRQLELAGIY